MRTARCTPRFPAPSVPETTAAAAQRTTAAPHGSPLAPAGLLFAHLPAPALASRLPPALLPWAAQTGFAVASLLQMLPVSERPLAWPAASVLRSQRSSPPLRPAPPATPAPKFRTESPLLQFWRSGLAPLLRRLAVAAAACGPPCRWRSAAAPEDLQKQRAPCIPEVCQPGIRANQERHLHAMLFEVAGWHNCSKVRTSPVTRKESFLRTCGVGPLDEIRPDTTQFRLNPANSD